MQNIFNFYQYEMTQYNTLNVKLSNSKLNKLNSAIKNQTEVVLRLSSNVIGNNETDFPYELLLTDRQVSNLRVVHQFILSYQNSNYQRSFNQEDFLVHYLVHY